MFPVLKTEIEARFESIESFLGATKDLDADHKAVAKGLIFVQIYAAYEFTVNRAVSTAIDLIKAHNHKIRDISPSLMTLILDPEFNAPRDGGRRNEWANRLRLFQRSDSTERVNISSDTRPPTDGSHYRYPQLQMIFNVFGIKRRPVRRGRHIQRIMEVVNHRNSIAHGDESPEDIGRKYTLSELRTVIRQMKSVCMLIVSVLDAYCANPTRHCR